MRQHAGWYPYTIYSLVKCEHSLFVSISLTTNKVKLFSLLGPANHLNVQEIRGYTHQTYEKQIENNLLVYSHLQGFYVPFT